MDVQPRPKPPKPHRDSQYLDLVRTQPCLFCGRQPAGQAHHVRWADDCGMGQKPSDYKTIPLCPGCHDDAHNAKIPAHIGREEVLEWMLDSVIAGLSRCREMVQAANNRLSGGGWSPSVQRAAEAFREMQYEDENGTNINSKNSMCPVW